METHIEWLHKLILDVEDGLAVRAHGLIYYLPLCHDFGNENI